MSTFAAAAIAHVGRMILQMVPRLVDFVSMHFPQMLVAREVKMPSV
jgi:hypothetical protein